MARMTVTERVERTALLLDRLYPRWFEKINVDSLRMDDPYKCVAGQLALAYTGRRYGYTYFVGRFVKRLGRSKVKELGIGGLNYQQADKLAFGVSGKRAWTDEILKRRALAAARKAVAA